MQRWTNDRYESTMHCVISPLSGKYRYSCAFFNDGPMDMTPVIVVFVQKEIFGLLGMWNRDIFTEYAVSTNWA